MIISAAVWLSPLSCRKSDPPRRFFCNDVAQVEGRASIDDRCTLELALRSSEVVPGQTVVPLLCPRRLFPIASPWFRPTPGSVTNCGSPVSESFTEVAVSCYGNCYTNTQPKMSRKRMSKVHDDDKSVPKRMPLPKQLGEQRCSQMSGHMNNTTSNFHSTSGTTDFSIQKIPTCRCKIQ